MLTKLGGKDTYAWKSGTIILESKILHFPTELASLRKAIHFQSRWDPPSLSGLSTASGQVVGAGDVTRKRRWGLKG